MAATSEARADAKVYHVSLVGGEIASQGDRLIDFYNKTVVVGAR